MAKNPALKPLLKELTKAAVDAALDSSEPSEDTLKNLISLVERIHESSGWYHTYFDVVDLLNELTIMPKNDDVVQLIREIKQFKLKVENTRILMQDDEDMLNDFKERVQMIKN